MLKPSDFDEQMETLGFIWDNENNVWTKQGYECLLILELNRRYRGVNGPKFYLDVAIDWSKIDERVTIYEGSLENAKPLISLLSRDE